MFESLKGFCTALMDDPPRIQVKWDKIIHAGFDGIKIVWWCIGGEATYSTNLLLWVSQYSHIPTKSGETYIVAARAHFSTSPHAGITEHYTTKWAYTIVEVPQIEDKPRYTDLGHITVIDTPRGPAILLDELYDVCGQ